jgi:hypothetical protein
MKEPLATLPFEVMGRTASKANYEGKMCGIGRLRNEADSRCHVNVCAIQIEAVTGQQNESDHEFVPPRLIQFCMSLGNATSFEDVPLTSRISSFRRALERQLRSEPSQARPLRLSTESCWRPFLKQTAATVAPSPPADPFRGAGSCNADRFWRLRCRRNRDTTVADRRRCFRGRLRHGTRALRI